MPTPQAVAVTAAEADALFADLQNAKALVLAVSGGPDSTALMVLAARWTKTLKRPPVLTAVTVDHGLRNESKREAMDVARLAKKLGIAHRTLRWTGAKPKTGLPQAARHARYRLLAAAARKAGSAHVLTAHTLDDQAETVIIRLLRGSGLTGLAAMQRTSLLPSPSPHSPSKTGVNALLEGEGWGGGYAATSASKKLPPSRRASRVDLPLKGGGEEKANDDILLVRPLLDIPKVRLISTLKAEKIPFAEDPTNHDPKFTRARLRGLMPQLAGEGLDAGRLALLARRLGRADAAIEATVDRATALLHLSHGERSDRDSDPGEGLRTIERVSPPHPNPLPGGEREPNCICVDREAFSQLPAEIALRLLGRAVAAVGSEGPVELAKLEALKTALDTAEKTGKPFRRSLAGAVVTLTGDASGGKIVIERAPPRRPGRGKALTKRRPGSAKSPKRR
jgi:tRNA(Ile)-lysidine synthase